MPMFFFRRRTSSKAKEEQPHEKNEPIQSKNSKRFQQFKNICTAILTFLFSRIGLCFVVVGYVLLGGIIFQAIEGSNEQEKALSKTLISDIVNFKTEHLIDEIWNMTKLELVFNEKNYTEELKSKIIDYKKNLNEAASKGYKGNTNGSLVWTFPEAVLYSITLITTIGYGHVTCQTDSGKIATMCYALIGIPMFIFCQFNIGSSMANVFRFLYSSVCCGYCNYVKDRNLKKRASTITSVVAKQAASITYVIANPVSQQDDLTSQITTDQKVNHQQEIFEEKNSSSKKITVPISVTVSVVVGYLFLGGILFRTLEGWNLMDGFYFGFITLMTIGLGDFVPGNSIKGSGNEGQYVLVLLSLWLLFGLSLVVMSINLMQEEIFAKTKRLGIKLGLIDDPNL